jgi:hypothetical protein
MAEAERAGLALRAEVGARALRAEELADDFLSRASLFRALGAAAPLSRRPNFPLRPFN